VWQRLTSEVVDKNMSYQKYLETVLDVSDESHEIGDLLNRYTTLESTNNEMRQVCVPPAPHRAVARLNARTWAFLCYPGRQQNFVCCLC